MLTILVVDSNEKTCSELESYCQCANGVCLLPSVHNGEEALLTLQNEQVDVLLIDIVLPVLDGLGTLAQLKQMAFQKRPSIFVHTAFYDERLLHELQRLDVMYCFVKPMNPSYIFPRIMQLLHAPEPLPVRETSVLLRTNDLGASRENDANELISAEITKQIRAVGVPAHLRGYHYLRSAIQYSVEANDPSAIAITKELYPYISVQYNTRPPLVERAIRNAIEVAWTRGNSQILQKFFGYTMHDHKGKPTNAEFIAMIADRVRMQTRG